MQLTDFNKEIKNNDDVITTYKNKLLILLHIKPYSGAITLQYLPYGGIQSLINYNLIICSKDKFITCNNVIYDNKFMSSKDFIINYNVKVNEILPS